jgi:hypothetical protein
MSADEMAPGAEPHATVTLVGATSTILGGDLRTVQEDEQVLVPFTRHNDVVVVPGSRARELVGRLERAGIDGDRISFLRIGDQTVPAHDVTPNPRLDVGPIGQSEERSVVAWAVLWGIIGALIVGLLVLAFSSASAAVWGALGGLVLGGALGALWAAFMRLGASDAWERTLHLEPGERAAVAVHLDDPDGNAGVTSILSPYGVWVFAADGSVVRRPAPGEAQLER